MHRVGSAAYWGAETSLPDGRKLRRVFNIETFGHDRAKELAIAERQTQLAQVSGIFLGNAPKTVVSRLSRRVE